MPSKLAIKIKNYHVLSKFIINIKTKSWNAF